MTENIQKLSDDLSKRGKLIEAGWTSLRAAVIRPDAPPIVVERMRKAFYSGAWHLFLCMTACERNPELCSDDEMRRKVTAQLVTVIGEELDEFRREIDLENREVEGHG